MDTCWSCGRNPGGGPFCDACGKVQPETPRDHFTVLGLPRRFAQDLADIEHRTRELQRKLHPDRFATKSTAERRMSLARATTVNEAYRTLRDPIRRAEYLLMLAGIPLPGEGQGGGTSDPELLEVMMEMREALEEARAASDAARVEALAADVRGRRDDAMSRIAVAFERSEPAEVGPLVHRLRYFGRFLDEVAAIEEAR